jgi:hypothetical protein
VDGGFAQDWRDAASRVSPRKRAPTVQAHGPNAWLLASRQLDFFSGTLAPFFRASESPIAIACLRLFTLPPLPPFPDRSVPFFLRRIALATVLPADLLYFRPPDLLRELDFFLAGMLFLPLLRGEDFGSGCAHRPFTPAG